MSAIREKHLTIRRQFPFATFTVGLVLVALVSACVAVSPSAQASSTATLSDRPDFKGEWLAGQLCKPPCILDIVPGQSSPDEVLSALKSNRYISNIKTIYIDPTQLETLAEIEWTWVGTTTSSGKWDGYIYFNNQTHSPYYISLGFPAGVSLNEVITAYGEPTHVFALSYHGTDTPSITEYQLEIIWLSQGFGLLWNSSLKPVISGDSYYYPFFFVPSLTGYTAVQKHALDPNLLTPWKGLLSFEEYCKTCSSQSQ